jgi:hypothetical protein
MIGEVDGLKVFGMAWSATGADHGAVHETIDKTALTNVRMAYQSNGNIVTVWGLRMIGSYNVLCYVETNKRSCQSVRRRS